MPFRSWGKALILCCITVIVYINSFHGVFQFDDYRMIVNYARAHSLASWLYYFTHNIRPLVKLSYTINWISGLGLFGFHLFNLTIHIINTLMVYLLSCKFFSRKEYLTFINASFLTAILFGIHPVQTEAVTYICGRSVSLMSMFYLASMFFYIKGADKGKVFLTFILSPLFFILAVLTRETAVTLPMALFLWDVFDKKEDRISKVLSRQAVHWALLLLILGAGAFHFKYEELLNFSYGLRGVRENLFSQFNGLYYLLSRLVAVNGLNIDPDIPAFSEWNPVVILKAIIIISLLIISLMTFKKRHWVSFGMLWFFLHLIPTNSIIPRLDIANERHMYLSVWGIFLIIAMGMEKVRILLYEQRKLIHSVILALFIALGYFTWSRNRDYRSEVVFWKDAVMKSPAKARCYNNLGFAYELEGIYEDARDAYAHASGLDPFFKQSQINLRRVEAILKGNK